MHLFSPSIIASSRNAAAIPSAASVAIFQNVGAIKLWDITGVVTVATGGAAGQTLQLLHVNAKIVAPGTPLCAATALGAGVAIPINDMIYIDGNVGNNMIQNALGVHVIQATPLILLPGSIYFATTRADTGSIRWSLAYTPLDQGAYVMPV